MLVMTLELAATEYGATGYDDRPPLLVLHGLFGSGRNWATVAKRLAASHRVLTLDLRNHGHSPWADAMDYGAMAADVRGFIAARDLGRVALVGHSMGGKVAMTLALQDAAPVERLVVVDIAPVPNPPRLHAYVKAMQALDVGRIGRRAEADAALAAVVTDPADRAFLLQNLVIEPGHVQWRLNLDAIERDMPAILGFPELAPGRVYDGPTLFVAGARSDYVRPEHEPAIRRLFPRAQIAHIAGAGHWVHAEQPEAFLGTLMPFLRA